MIFQSKNMAEHHKHHGLFHHKKDDEENTPVEAVILSDTTTYPDTAYGSGYTETTTTAVVADEKDYEKEVKHHGHKEHLGELGAVAAGAFALVYFSSLFYFLHLYIYPLSILWAYFT